jgi:rhodanese-related sulfurtransferase
MTQNHVVKDHPMHQDIDIAEFQEQFANNAAADYALIDVREVEEFEQGHIPGAINIPMNTVPARVGEITTEKPVVLVCARGSRSEMVAEFLTGQGYRQLYNLTDGTLGWMMRGLPLE